MGFLDRGKRPAPPASGRPSPVVTVSGSSGMTAAAAAEIAMRQGRRGSKG